MLLAKAKRQAAGLLIIGADRHSRLREIVFSGFTRRLQRSPPLPTLPMH